MSTSEEGRDHLGALGRIADAAAPAEAAVLLGELERLKALVWQRLIAAAAVAAAPPREALDDLRHVTPAQVAELLNLKEAYVHELCRTRRLPAVKHGKYWLIPQAALRQWLTYPVGDVDGSTVRRIASPNLREDTSRGATKRARRSPTLV